MPVNKYRQLAMQRVEAAWNCVGVLCPDLTPKAKKVLAEKVLDLCAEREKSKPEIKITPPEVQEIVWRNMQCVNPHCPMVLFSREIAAKLNEFFKQEE